MAMRAYWKSRVEAFVSLTGLRPPGGWSGPELQVLLLFVEITAVRAVPPTQAEMARVLGRSKPGIRKHVVVLQRKEILSRVPNSRRSVALSPEWREKLGALNSRLFTRLFKLRWKRKLDGRLVAGREDKARLRLHMIRQRWHDGVDATLIVTELKGLLRESPAILRKDIEELLGLVKGAAD